MSHVRISPAVLKWAQERAGLSQEQLAKKVGLGSRRIEELHAWEKGLEQPTFRQAQALARALHIPIGYLFLSSPPSTTLPVADFRSIPENERGKFSPDLQDVLNDALRKRDWFREWRIREEYAPLPFIGRFDIRANPELIVEDIRRSLSLPKPTGRESKNQDEHMRFLVHHAEEAGILVLQSGIVQNNSKRTLSVQEFRGFALTDNYAPLIFINARDYRSARIFTLAHELGHIWTNTSGISNPEFTLTNHVQTLSIERLCNKIAAELLVPADILAAKWGASINLLDEAQNLAKQFKVSVFVILIRLYELDLIPKSEFEAALVQANADVKETQVVERGGGDFYSNLLRRNSRLFVHEITSAITEGQILHKEAAQLLNIHPWTLENALQRWQ